MRRDTSPATDASQTCPNRNSLSFSHLSPTVDLVVRMGELWHISSGCCSRRIEHGKMTCATPYGGFASGICSFAHRRNRHQYLGTHPANMNILRAQPRTDAAV